MQVEPRGVKEMAGSALRKLVFFLFAFSIFWLALHPAKAEETEKTYAISLTKTAGIQKGKIETVGKKKVLVSSYVVSKGDHLWQILRKKQLLKTGQVGEVLSMLKQLNPALRNLNLIHPGQRVMIPLKIVPLSAAGMPPSGVTKTIAPEDLKNLKVQNYTVEPGDALTRVIEGRYRIPPKKLYGEYLTLVKRLNPNIRNLNVILPGQRIKLPIYSPEIVRQAIIPQTSPNEVPKSHRTTPNPLKNELAQIFSELGEDWDQTGQQFIPVSTGGQINLGAESFPILTVETGRRVIVDLNDELPQKVADLIQSSWSTYRVVHLTENDDLRSALGKILKACDFQRMYRPGHPLEIGGDIRLRITGDWILGIPGTAAGKEASTAVITLRNGSEPTIPWMIKDYLKGLRINVIDYPPGNDHSVQEAPAEELIRAPRDPAKFTEMILNRLGEKFSRSMTIPVYENQAANVKLLIKADFYLNLGGQECVIDLSGLGERMVSFLKAHRFKVLLLHGETDRSKMLTEMLDFLGVPYKSGPHSFLACSRDVSRDVTVTLKGVSFHDDKGHSILATEILMPEDMVAFLSRKGYETLDLNPGPSGPDKGKS